MPPDLNHYRVLGISRRASSEQIRAAYVALLKRYHPDSSQDESEHQNGAHVHRIVAAYNTLKDPRRRAVYDAELRQVAQRQVAQRKVAQRHAVPRPTPYVPPRRRRKKAPWTIDLNALTYLVAGIAAAIGLQLLVWGYDRYQRTHVGEPQSVRGLVQRLNDVPTAVDLMPVAKQAGIMSGSDATRYSAQCFAQASRSANPTAADRCVAFDTAYLYWRETVAGAFVPEPYFQSEAIKSRNAGAYARLGPDAAMVRVASIRAATFQALLRVTSIPDAVMKNGSPPSAAPEPESPTPLDP